MTGAALLFSGLFVLYLWIELDAYLRGYEWDDDDDEAV